MKKQIYIFLIILTLLASILMSENLTTDSLPIIEAKDHKTQEVNSIITYRNDDVSEASSANFQKINQVFIQNQIPITHGIIPKPIKESKNTKKICKKFRNLERENPEIIHFSLHGYNHNLSGKWPSEFYNKSKKIQREKISKGVKFFEQCIGRSPKTFIPPGNLYDKTTKEVLSSHEITLLSGYNEKIQNKWSKNEAKIPYDREILVNSVNSKFVISWQDKKLANSKNLKKKIRNSAEKNNLHTQMLHYKTFSGYETRDGDEPYENLVSVINFTENLNNTTIMNLGQISSKLESEKLKVLDEGGWKLKN